MGPRGPRWAREPSELPRCLSGAGRRGKAGEQSAGLSCPPQPRGGYGKGDQTLEGAAQGGAGGVPMPGERQDAVALGAAVWLTR